MKSLESPRSRTPCMRRSEQTSPAAAISESSLHAFVQVRVFFQRAFLSVPKIPSFRGR
jgi:hypothetical protein